MSSTQAKLNVLQLAILFSVKDNLYTLSSGAEGYSGVEKGREEEQAGSGESMCSCVR